MKFKELKVGQTFIVPKDKDDNKYVKIGEWAKLNTRCIKPWNKIITIHGSTEVKEINNGL